MSRIPTASGVRWKVSTRSVTRQRWWGSVSTSATPSTTSVTMTLAPQSLLQALHERRFDGRLVVASSMVVYGEGSYTCVEHGDVRPPPRRRSDLETGRWEPGCPWCGLALEPRPVTEATPPDPRNVYAATKLHQEHLCAACGPRARRSRRGIAIPQRVRPEDATRHPLRGCRRDLPERIRGRGSPLVFEDGRQRRDFVHVRDVAHANLLALGADRDIVGTFNIATGEPHTVLEMAQALGRGFPVGTPAPIVVPRFRLGDVRHVFGAPDAARAALGFQAAVSFEAGMTEFARVPLRAETRVRPESDPNTALAPYYEHPIGDAVNPDLREASDAALIVAIARFRQEALAEAYRRHGDATFGLARRVIGEPSLAEEVVQEVFIRLWNDPERFDPGRGSMRSFLMANVHSRAIDLVRAESSRRAREVRQARLHDDVEYDLEREIWDLTVAEQIRRSLERLSDDERRAIELAYLGGHTYREGRRVARTTRGHGQEPNPCGAPPAA